MWFDIFFLQNIRFLIRVLFRKIMKLAPCRCWSGDKLDFAQELWGVQVQPQHILLAVESKHNTFPYRAQSRPVCRFDYLARPASYTIKLNLAHQYYCFPIGFLHGPGALSSKLETIAAPLHTHLGGQSQTRRLKRHRMETRSNCRQARVAIVNEQESESRAHVWNYRNQIIWFDKSDSSVLLGSTSVRSAIGLWWGVAPPTKWRLDGGETWTTITLKVVSTDSRSNRWKRKES
jgi:hypothetical protein